MRQVLLHTNSGKIELVEVPVPRVRSGHLLIKTRASLISAGTERMLIELGKSALINKARRQPDKARQVIDKLRMEGLLPTFRAVRTKLDQPLALGYSNAGKVINVGKGVSGFSVGDRAISNGPHAEIVCVPQNLCAKIPADTSFEDAAFTVLGSIALQGLRLAQPTLGETFAVTGLGLVGLLMVQLLKINGCRVIGIDLEPSKLRLASQLGAEIVDLSKGVDPVGFAETFTNGRGVDGVLVTATTKSSEPLHQAAQMCRKKGRIILVGVTGLELSRDDFYEKELTFQVSCSYGPGRYDTSYELKGQDYPFGYVRWTEKRNFEAILDLIGHHQLKVDDLITHRFEFRKALNAYKTLTSDSSSVGLVLSYAETIALVESAEQTVRLAQSQRRPFHEGISVGVIGSGSYASQTLLPALGRTGVRLKTIASRTGVSSTRLATKYRFEESTTDVEALIKDPEINVIFIATRHDSHARFVRESILAKKHVFVEKPLAITSQDLKEIEDSYVITDDLILMVGFNRRFAPHIVKTMELLSSLHEPKSFILTVNAGFIPHNHWVHDPQIGGGRIVGEACHFIDLLRFLSSSRIVEIQSIQMGSQSKIQHPEDRMTFALKFEDGSFGSVHYLANGNRRFPKERLEVFCGGRILQLNNFRKLKGFGWPSFSTMNLWFQDKGHRACIQAFIDSVNNNKPSPIVFDELVEVTRTSFEIAENAS